MRRYESIFIASPVLAEEQVEELVKQFEGIIAEQGGELLKTDKWGRRKLAYDIKKFSEGYYTLFELNAGSKLIAELERRYRNNENVIKYLSVRIDEIMKASERQKVRYEREGKRKAAAGIKERTLEEVMG
ncbi:MAG: 30S ribosomal protein S6 [Holophagaceae bacterium]|nr:30S ribosomal protein S6 [Holophagaceae bacterium]